MLAAFVMAFHLALAAGPFNTETACEDYYQRETDAWGECMQVVATLRGEPPF